MYFNMYNHHHHHCQDGPRINIEVNGDFGAMKDSWLYTQVSILYLLKLESEQVYFSTISFF